ncbi:4Fe-4S dicluster domain-containing protein [Leptospira ilyithenensis]|uniref:Hydrogenase n=1 Tax=Leptospira ilyithenensis TaxID=2484901 RepID=A0A4R9LTR2_9LEPT|nr:4Fe-4S dicluster domain-containing protein [Leptospira ilyithenensis]TGN13771.1 hydrogenase [Leptospira ilyithenensis]
MKRKDLFKEGFKSVFQFAFEKTDDLSQAIKEVWEDEKKATDSPEEKKFPKKRVPKEKIEKRKKTKLFRTLSLPPGATNHFFSLCTGCNECIFSCPYTVLFPVTSQETRKSFPFFDPNAKACHLCEDWPCIQACPEKALETYDVLQTKPKFGKAKSLHEHCINHKTGEKTCDVCFTACPIEKTVQFKGNMPVFASSTCTGCGLCVESCPSFPKAIRVDTLKNINID